MFVCLSTCLHVSVSVCVAFEWMRIEIECRLIKVRPTRHSNPHLQRDNSFKISLQTIPAAPAGIRINARMDVFSANGQLLSFANPSKSYQHPTHRGGKRHQRLKGTNKRQKALALNGRQTLTRIHHARSHLHTRTRTHTQTHTFA